MKRKVIWEMLLTLLVFLVAGVVFMVVPVSASGTIYVDRDWKLTADIFNNPVVIVADNIVLDLNGYGIIAPETPPSWDDGIQLNGRTGVTIKNGKIERWGYGISLLDSSNNLIENVKISKSVWCGIYLSGSSSFRASKNNIISGCTIISSGWWGIFFSRYADNNFVQNCLITSNGVGIELFSSASYNAITDNEISKNNLGIEHWGTGRFNVIYHNNFVDNSIQATTSGAPNSWDDGYPSGGNYWSDYNGVDEKSGPGQDQPGSDGIGDTPYVISGLRKDNYPLMQPVAQVEIQSLEKTIELWNLPKGTENSLTSKLDDAIHLLDQGNTNGAVHKLGDFINQVTRSKKLTGEQKDMLITAAQAIIDHLE